MSSPAIQASSFAIAVGILTLGLGGAAHAQSPAAFFNGKTVTLNVGFCPGGGYDLNTRMFARHFGKLVGRRTQPM